ncbi:DUF2986 domain-containing protein [Shewanella sp. KT0246]|uniref:DUF2986 domain-containing protein n=1 Tax=Shewanella sp. KT0246 TaxID=2815912 RepID=UPI001BBD432C|nr:DUF2986 domain-containing protein [Shewanella sp. KT0246]GIU52456.1 DUF2986 domain-containing protein [Shewanella sp. KT0246]
MNRRKKINQTLKGKAKKANAKKAGSNKPKYIAKADRVVASVASEGIADVAKEESQDVLIGAEPTTEQAV